MEIHSSGYPGHFQNPYHSWLQANIHKYVSQFNPHTTINSADFRLGLAADPFIVAYVKPDLKIT